MADKYSTGIVKIQNAKNGLEAREAIADILNFVNEDSGGSVKYLVGDDPNNPITWVDVMTPEQVKNVFDTGKISIDGKDAYVYVTGIDNTITENAKKKAITNKAFYAQLGLIGQILDAILYTRPLKNSGTNTEGE